MPLSARLCWLLQWASTCLNDIGGPSFWWPSPWLVTGFSTDKFVLPISAVGLGCPTWIITQATTSGSRLPGFAFPFAQQAHFTTKKAKPRSITSGFLVAQPGFEPRQKDP